MRRRGEEEREVEGEEEGRREDGRGDEEEGEEEEGERCQLPAVQASYITIHKSQRQV